MIRLRHKLFIQAFRLSDQIIPLFGLFFVSDLLPRALGHQTTSLFDRSFRFNDALLLLLLFVGWLFAYDRLVCYDANRFTGLQRQLTDVIKATAAASFLLSLSSAFLSFTKITNIDVVIFWATTSLLAVLSRIASWRFLLSFRRSGRNYRHLLILGLGERSRSLAARIQASPELGYKIVGFVATDESDVGNSDIVPAETAIPLLGTLADLQRILEAGTVDEMMICLNAEERFSVVTRVVRLGRELGVVVRLLPSSADARLLERLHVEMFDGKLVVTLFRERFLFQLLAKRVIDVSISFFLLILLSPLMLCIAVLIKLTSPGPALFVQERVGMNRRRFRLYKFRSMVVDAEQRRAGLESLNEMDGPVFKIQNDPRITRVGAFIRKTSIDELPQLINVLAGDMSLVGPRPPLPSEVQKYEWLFQRRLSIKPGLTCLWQISGRNTISFSHWMALDASYVENWSLWLDLKILLCTIPVVLFRKGAS